MHARLSHRHESVRILVTKKHVSDEQVHTWQAHTEMQRRLTCESKGQRYKCDRLPSAPFFCASIFSLLAIHPIALSLMLAYLCLD